MDKTRRMFVLHEQLKRRGSLTNRAIRALLGVDRQTVRRDILSLDEAGVRIQTIRRGSDTEYRLEERPHQRERVTGYEALALGVGRDLLHFVRGTDLHGWLDALGEKLAYTEDAHRIRGALANRIVFWSEPYREYETKADVLDDVLSALQASHELELHYEGPGGLRHFEEVRPLALVIYRRALYLLFRIGRRARLWRLAIDRITSARWTRTPFRYPRRFDVHQALGRTFGIYDDGRHRPARIRLRFDADVAHLVRERVWHPGFVIHEEPDGCVVLEMRANGRELVRLVLEWGPRVVVIEPEWLRREVIDAVRRTLDRYRT